MNLAEFFLYFSFLVLFYTYLGYPILMYLFNSFDFFKYLIRVPEGYGRILINPKIAGYLSFKEKIGKIDFEPFVTVIIAAYNEEKVIEEKIRNCLELDYPKDKIEFLFATDGSTDNTPQIIKKFSEKDPRFKLFHSENRLGKLKAIKRIIEFARGEIILFSDANGIYNRDAIKKLVRHFILEKVGCVAGEKRIADPDGKTHGESTYWKYESLLKSLDSEIYTTIGAAGEIFAIRKHLFLEIPEDTIIEDFVLSLEITARGYRIVYEPEAYSIETPSKSFREDFIRRFRISQGGIQSIFILRRLLNFRNYKFLSFQLLSHRILRWTLAPLSLLILFFSNFFLVIEKNSIFYEYIFTIQLIFYLISIVELIFESFDIRIPIFHLIFSFILMNFASVLALITYPFISKSNIWKRVERK